ncbi:ATP-binding cassette domain-containing protein [Patescibacteria group bacterium]|nr:ATP-binding cassette domain-containing protein [Patescibacteria group bacterium]
MPQIEFKEVTKEYEPGFKALDDVSFSVASGEYLFIVGASGAGKSTVVRLLVREEQPSAGEIWFDDENILMFEGTQISDLRRSIGVVFQDFKLLESKNVFENVAIALEVVNASDFEIRNIVPNVLSMVSLSDKMFKYPRQLSGGEKQKLSIARALAHEPDVLVADEPTGMIDPDSADEILEILDKINSLGTTIIMATHNAEVVDKMKKRVIRLDRGQIVSDKKGGKYRG